MWVIETTGLGGPELLQIAERPDPELRPGAVIVDIHAASVNAADWKVRKGLSKMDGPLPYVLGRDFSGVVSQAAEGTGFAVGDEVFCVCPHGTEGAYAEKIVMGAEFLAPKPANVTHVEAAAIGLAGMTAMIAIEVALDVQRGEKVLVQGGAGGVGGMAVQFAHKLGAEVVATSRRENHAYVTSLGADRVIDYREEDVAAALGDCDAALDTVGGQTVESTFGALRDNGRAAFVSTGPTPPTPPRHGMSSIRPDVFRNRERIEALAARIVAGDIVPPKIERLSPRDARQAHELSEAGHVCGKLVFDMTL